MLLKLVESTAGLSGRANAIDGIPADSTLGGPLLLVEAGAGMVTPKVGAVATSNGSILAVAGGMDGG